MKRKWKYILPLLCLIAAVMFHKPLWNSLYTVRFLLSNPTQAEKTVMTYAMQNGLSYTAYPKSLIELLQRNPETLNFVLEYPLKKDIQQEIHISQYADADGMPLFLQWDPQWGYLPYGSDVAGLTACGPLCLSMVAFHLTGNTDYSPDKMIAFATENGYYSPGNGSSWTLISEGGVKLGFDVTEIPLDRNRIFVNLELGNPIICAMGPGDFTSTGHYIVLTGLENGMVKINDPNSIANSQKLWDYNEIQDQIRNLWVIRN